MKRKLLFIFLLAVGLNASSQNVAEPTKSGNIINVGLLGGLGSSAIYAGYDIPIFQDITIGPEGRLQMWNGITSLGIVANGDYHFNRVLNIPENVDFYAGFDLGLGLTFYNGFNAGLYLGMNVGGRYYWSDWGVNAEVGIGSGFGGGKLGISKRF